MGVFDTVYFTDSKGKEQEIQFKCGECRMLSYEIGSDIDIRDGIYFDYRCCFVVFGSKIVAAFDESENPLITKRGFPIPFIDLNNL